ncbi:ABC transporter substrate-binding protein [Cohnella hashimotonis]|uniref:ABC transporter substrate-binding protein n=1 Tax=Cohnella hashimotonis TaxID=2826895 RepID=A0ABT6TMF8_9BACL|nr:ABC transporter substrate-binding protein [Cohnella hashimotonis]MDI4647022.1 ABC transporter substrate-binding protein [Cohnella hashimotonis]
MINAKKWMGYILMLSLIAAALAACSKNESGNKPSAASSPTNAPSNTASQAAQQEELNGTINITLPQQSSEVWNKVAAAYMAKHPKVKVNVEIKPLSGYKEWLTAQFAAGDPQVDLAMINEVADLQAQRKFVNYYPWFDKTNPYTGKPWKDSFNLEAMGVNLGAVGADDSLYVLNFETVQILWLYNKDIFAKLGVTEPPATFNELIEIFKKAKAAGYTPFALAGDSSSIWSGQAGWLMRIYPDQYFRDSIETARSQEADYTYNPDIDDVWKYDAADPYNDSESKVTKNPIRVWKAIKEQQGDYKMAGNPKWKAVMENLKTLFSYTPEGFFGTNEAQAYKLFLTGKAAVMLGAPSAYWQLPKDLADAEKTGVKDGVKPFEFGFFNMPSMEGEYVQAPARTIQLPIGFYGLVQKDAKQTALSVDFMMYLTSPEGYGVYVTAIQNSRDAALNGPPALNDITLPEEMSKAFASFKQIGNLEGLQGPSNTIARGLQDYQPSVQEYVSLVQRYFYNSMTVDDYLAKMQEQMLRYLPEALTFRKLDVSDLDNPERQPPKRE